MGFLSSRNAFSSLTLGAIRDEPYFAELLETLLEEATRVSELNAFREERNRDRAVKARVLSRDIEATKTELQEFDSGGWRISLLRDYIDHLHDLKKRWNQIQAMEENVLNMSEVFDNITDEDGV